MKRTILCVMLLTLLSLLVLSSGCGNSQNGDKTGDDQNGKVDEEVTQTDYDIGLVEGYGEGYDRGYSDGKQGDYNPEPELDGDWNEDYTVGYEEGFLEGYEGGYDDAVEESGGEEAEVEAAMVAFVKQNSAPGLEFEIQNIVINGNEAVGIAVCTSERLESPLVIMKKGPSGWYAVDFGTGIEPPDWYTY